MTDYPPPIAAVPPPPPSKTGRQWKTWQLILAAVVALFVGVGIGAAGKQDDNKKTVAAASSSSSSSETTTTTTAPTTTTTTVPKTTTTTLPPEPVVVADISGSNNTSTDDFTVVGKWTITGEVSGGAGIGVRIMRGASQYDYFQFDSETGGGVNQQRQGGTFYLDLSTFGSNYHVFVTDIPG